MDTVPVGKAFDKIQTSIKAGRPYDVGTLFFIGDVIILASEGKLAPLNDIIKKYDGVRASCSRWTGTTTGTPTTTTCAGSTTAATSTRNTASGARDLGSPPGEHGGADRRRRRQDRQGDPASDLLEQRHQLPDLRLPVGPGRQGVRRRLERRPGSGRRQAGDHGLSRLLRQADGAHAGPASPRRRGGRACAASAPDSSPTPPAPAAPST